MDTIAVVLKGYPRLSETFIAQELLSLERAGLDLVLFSLRHPTDRTTHPVHEEIRAPVNYLPEYLHHEPLRVLRALLRAPALPGLRPALAAWLRDLVRDRTRNRIRRFGQALVLATELPPRVGHLHAHFIHTPASVTGYAATLRRLPWSCSAHAKDIWTTGAGELAAKLAAARWVVTCSTAGQDALRELAPDPSRVHLCYHGLDLARFAPYAGPRPPRDGRSAAAAVELLAVGRAVPKKGLDVLLDALASLPEDLHWRLTHIGEGECLEPLKARADRLGLNARVRWAGALPQQDVLAACRDADVFVLPCRVADDGDRDGLPNVLLEAASQRLACVSTQVSAVPEFIESDRTGLLVPPENPPALARALERLIGDPPLRERLGGSAQRRVLDAFDHDTTVGRLLALLRPQAGAPSRERAQPTCPRAAETGS